LFEDVKFSLLSKEKCDLEVHSDDKAEGLFVRERSSEKKGTNRGNFKSKSKGVNPANSVNNPES